MSLCGEVPVNYKDRKEKVLVRSDIRVRLNGSGIQCNVVGASLYGREFAKNTGGLPNGDSPLKRVKNLDAKERKGEINLQLLS